VSSGTSVVRRGARVIGLFGAVLALATADAATVGAIAPQLVKALHINFAEIGLLSTVALLVGAVFVAPVGMLVESRQADPAAVGQHRPLERGLARERVRR